jgi:hypothetical protein
MPSVMFGINLYIKSRGDGQKLWLMKTEEEVKSIPVIVAAGQAEKGAELPHPPGGYRWKEIVLTYAVSPFTAPSEVKINVLEKWLNDVPKPGGAGYMNSYDDLQGFQWSGTVSPGASSFLTAEYMAPNMSPRMSGLELLVPRTDVLYAPTTTHDIGALGKGGKGGGGGGHHHHGGGRRGGRGWGGGWGWWGPGPLYAEDLPVIIVDGQERRMTEAEWEAEKKRREEEAKKKKALASFVDAESLSSGAQFGQGPDDISFNPMNAFGALTPNTYETDWRSFMGDVDKAVKTAFDAMKSELKAKGLRLAQIPTNQAVVGDFVVTAECKLCTIAANHAQGGLVLREIHPNKGQLWRYQPGIDPPFACAFGIRR